MVVMVKTNTKICYKDTTDNLKNDCPGGSYLLLMSKSMVPGGRPIIAIGCKYNYRTAGITYLYKYPETFSNVKIRPVACPLLLYKFLGSVYEVESHNKSRQYDLAMEMFWVTWCCWIWLCMEFYMGMTITNCWKLFLFGVKRYYYENLIGIT